MTGLNQNSDLRSVGQRFGLLTLTEPSRGHGDEVANASLNRERDNGDEEDDQLIVENQDILGDERPSSSTSSGYAGERGSSSATSESRIDEASEIDGNEIHEVRNHGFLQGFSDNQASPWVPGKRYVDEDDGSIAWRKRKKHFFILCNSGKPIYSRGDSIKLIKAGKHQVVFLVKGPIYLVCISCIEEPLESLKAQLELIYGQVALIVSLADFFFWTTDKLAATAYSRLSSFPWSKYLMILILTKSINRCFEKNPKFDMTPLLRGTDDVFSSLIHSFSWNPATFVHAYTCLPLAYATRQAVGAILQDVADSGVLFVILMCQHKVISLVGAQKASLHPDDLLLLSTSTSESFSPICLPKYNPMAFLYAHVHFLDVDTYLILLTTSSDAFYHLKDCRIRIERVLLKSNVLSEVQRSMIDGGMHVQDLPLDPLPRSGSSPHLSHQRLPTDSPDRLPTDSPKRSREPFVGLGGPAGLWHFIYRSIFLEQYISSEFSPPINSPQQQKRLYRAYQRLYASMHDEGIGPHKTQFRRDEIMQSILSLY
ncbi:double-stranded RNA-binding protein 2-like [Hibiscus syriacus]|uniref:Vacuolar fusion protein MON1 homolog n=1 Tax=Hibiscus syriacus TaxID=106335 RepID=A0A6A3CZ64_HIBSY|nr:double-stranded RNA-binding protein 2-like [Hibiscus syriacus]